MSFNIRMGLANDGINNWDFRKSMTLGRINEFSPDLLGIQECYDNEAQAGFLKRRLSGYEFIGVQRGGYSGAAMEMAPALFKKSGFKLLGSGCFWLSETPGRAGSLNWDASFPRTCLWLRLWHYNTNKILIFLNTHFDYQPTAIIGSARVLRDWLRRNADMPLIVTGDFNTDKESESYQLLTKELIDTRPNNDHTFHDFGRIAIGGPIDWILASAHFRIVQSRIDHYHENDVYPSDHYPLLAILDWQS